MAEHELCKLGVTGSNPVASTIRRVPRGARALLMAGQAWRGDRSTRLQETADGPALSEAAWAAESKGV